MLLSCSDAAACSGSLQQQGAAKPGALAGPAERQGADVRVFAEFMA